MMTVEEYALDINKTVEEILKKCSDLNIEVSDPSSLLTEEDIIILDNANYDEMEEIEDIALEYTKKEKINLENGVNKKKKRQQKPNNIINKKEFASKKKEMYKNKEK